MNNLIGLLFDSNYKNFIWNHKLIENCIGTFIFLSFQILLTILWIIFI